MNATATAPEMPATVSSLQKLAKELGLTGMGSANEATLVPAITEEQERRVATPATSRRVGRTLIGIGLRTKAFGCGEGAGQAVDARRVRFFGLSRGRAGKDEGDGERRESQHRGDGAAQLVGGFEAGPGEQRDQEEDGSDGQECPDGQYCAGGTARHGHLQREVRAWLPV